MSRNEEQQREALELEAIRVLASTAAIIARSQHRHPATRWHKIDSLLSELHTHVEAMIDQLPPFDIPE
jgi:hypothetical protein